MIKQVFILFIGISMALTGCKSRKNPTAETNQSPMETEANIIEKKWQLIELAGAPVTETINGKIPFIQLSEEENRYSASAGCNGLGGTFTLENNGRIKFSQGMSTMMACEHMEIETGFKKVLEQADNYTIKGDTLSLNKARMAPLARFQLVKENKTTELNGTWELNYISGAKIAFDGLFPNKKPSITFNLPETGITGNGGCNNFRAPFSIDGNAIKFKDPVATRMACPGNGEASFFKSLKTITSYSVNEQTLTLIMGDIALMRFQKK